MNIDFDELYYIYCIKLNRAEQEFWGSTLEKVMAIIQMYLHDLEKNKDGKQDVIASMKEIEGWI